MTPQTPRPQTFTPNFQPATIVFPSSSQAPDTKFNTNPRRNSGRGDGGCSQVMPRANLEGGLIGTWFGTKFPTEGVASLLS